MDFSPRVQNPLWVSLRSQKVCERLPKTGAAGSRVGLWNVGSDLLRNERQAEWKESVKGGALWNGNFFFFYPDIGRLFLFVRLSEASWRLTGSLLALIPAMVSANVLGISKMFLQLWDTLTPINQRSISSLRGFFTHCQRREVIFNHGVNSRLDNHLASRSEIPKCVSFQLWIWRRNTEVVP